LSINDLSQLYQAEAHLTALDDVLQRLELKHVSQLDALYTLMHNAAVRLEDSENKEETASQTSAATPR
jgi:type VI secretion system protein VasL